MSMMTLIKRYAYIVGMVIAINSLLVSLAEASSNLELKGTVFTRPVTTTAADNKDSCNGARSLKPIAIIKDVKTGRVNMYEAGENVGMVKILEVKRAEVILQEGKAKYVLALPAGSVKQPERIDFDIARKDATFYIDRAEINKAILKAPQIMRDIKIMPHFTKGRLQGMRLSRVKQGSIFEKAGVKSGDVVKTVNGMLLNTPHQIFQAYRKLKDKRVFKVEIMRDGKESVLNYIIEAKPR